uniref:Uncharacterized protein n=1 Tax=Meleagris gallopavo TaxID=9103 RepID=G1N4U7_MELGA
EAWLQEFKEKAVDVLKQHTITTGPDSALKLKEAEEAQSTLQAECEQYRAILAETEGMLRNLQKSVEEEEQVWKAKLTLSEEELQKVRALGHLSVLLQKEYISLLEAQLENHLQTASSERQNYTKEVEGLRQLLSESQEQLEAAKTETQKQSKELTLVRQQLSEMKSHVQDGEVAGSQADLAHPVSESSVHMLLELWQAMLPQPVLWSLCSVEVCSPCCLLELLGPLRAGRLRLEKEKKLTRDLGQAATKLQELLKVTQDQLAKERETVKKLKEQLHEKVLVSRTGTDAPAVAVGRSFCHWWRLQECVK